MRIFVKRPPAPFSSCAFRLPRLSQFFSCRGSRGLHGSSVAAAPRQRFLIELQEFLRVRVKAEFTALKGGA